MDPNSPNQGPPTGPQGQPEPKPHPEAEEELEGEAEQAGDAVDDESTEEVDEAGYEDVGGEADLETFAPVPIVPLPQAVSLRKKPQVEEVAPQPVEPMEPPGWATILGGKIVAVIVCIIGLASIAAIVAAIWYFFHKVVLAPQ